MNKDTVILLHGLGRTRLSLFKLAASLKPNYHVINVGYPSRRYSVETLAEMAIKPAIELSKAAPKVHFVTHSMGGILVRQYLSTHDIPNLGNTLMLGPPNKGSELVDFFVGTPFLGPLFKAINGPAGIQLGTTHSAKPQTLGAATFALGIIAGSQSTNPFFNKIISGIHDGKVSVQSSKLEGMSDHIVMPVNHTFMMQNNRVIEQIKYFLKFGHFNHNRAQSSRAAKNLVL